MKPIYEREIWKVLHEVAKHLRLAAEHEVNFQTKTHIDDATKEIDEWVVKDIKQAAKCQRNVEVKNDKISRR